MLISDSNLLAWVRVCFGFPSQLEKTGDLHVTAGRCWGGALSCGLYTVADGGPRRSGARGHGASHSFGSVVCTVPLMTGWIPPVQISSGHVSSLRMLSGF